MDIINPDQQNKGCNNMENQAASVLDSIKDSATTIANSAVVKVAPPVTVVGLNMSGITMSDIAMGLTIVYTAIMIILTIRDRLLPRKGGRRKSDRAVEAEPIEIPHKEK
jgi:hypothetical protein